MAFNTRNGLMGLRGLTDASEDELRSFVQKYSAVTDGHENDYSFIDRLFKASQYIDKFGVEDFNENIDDDSYRQKKYDDIVAEEEWAKLYSPMNLLDGTRNNHLGLGADWEKYNAMPTEYKRQVLESDYLSPKEFEDKWSKELPDMMGMVTKDTPWWAINPNAEMGVATTFTEQELEVAKEASKSRNQRIIDKIYNNYLEEFTKSLGDTVQQAYYDKSLASLNDVQITDLFAKEIVPNSYEGNLGIPELASHYGDGSQEALEKGDLDELTIDEKRQILAKKKTYEAFMSPEAARDALNNEAKRYITAHQTSGEKAALLGRDILISSVSYSVDKVNGLIEPVRWAADAIDGKPVVFVDGNGEIIDSNRVQQDVFGTYYEDEEGRRHNVHQEEISRSALHQMGKNTDGSEDNGLLNPQYWTKAEQWGTLDKLEQKRFDTLGSSPYKVAYNPNEDWDLWYEAFKMSSFALADGMSSLVPWGIGQAGNVLSTASKMGKVMQGIGKGMQWVARVPFGQVSQGLVGAGGIAYAYQRGMFQETLTKNLAELDESVFNRAQREISKRYKEDEAFRSQVDAQVEAVASALSSAPLEEAGQYIIDKDAYNQQVLGQARDRVFQELVQNHVDYLKGTPDYASMQNEAINSTGKAAFLSYLLEAGKYGYTNTLGFRKYLFSSPTAIQKVRQNFNGITETTTSAGRKRLTSGASKFLTSKDKWKQLGKTAGSQFWGGSWTNFTDDMTVDAAERINDDSFSRYMNAYENGEAIADTYGFMDGLFSFTMGLYNSIGQETTWNAGIVGGVGSFVSFGPNFTNIAPLMTKSGRQAFRDTFTKKTLRNEDGSPQRDENGNIITENVSWKDNWRDRAAFFIQNGLLSEYYGAKQSERDLQNHVDYVNGMLDDYDDFQAIEELVASDLEVDNAINVGDATTMRYIKAINTMKALEQIGNNTDNPALLSSVVRNAQSFIDRASKMSFNQEEKDAFSDEEINGLLDSYYGMHQSTPRSEANNQKALYNISHNAQELKAAKKAWDNAEQQIQNIEKSKGIAIDSPVRNRLKLHYALDGHWGERIKTMQDEIDDTSDAESTNTDGHVLLLSVGGRRNAQRLHDVYERQKSEIQELIAEQTKEIAKLRNDYDDSVKNLEGTTDSNTKYALQQKVMDARNALDNAIQQKLYYESLLSASNEKQGAIDEALQENEGQPQDNKVGILTADAIFALDPTTRARMLDPNNRSIYSEKQQAEIEKLEKRLLMRDADALQKVQDIALLSKRIQANMDAYHRISENPEAAAYHLEAQRAQSAQSAEMLINRRNADTVVDVIHQFDDSMKGRPDITQEAKDYFVYRSLRKLNGNLLDIISKESLLPDYSKQVSDAKEWQKTIDDLSNVVAISDMEDSAKQSLMSAIDSVVESANTTEEMMTALEKMVDTFPALEGVLNSLEKLDYSRDSSVIESRKQKKEREAKQKEEEAAREKHIQDEVRKAQEETTAPSEADEVADWNPSKEDLDGAEDIPIDFSGREESVEESSDGTSEDESSWGDNDSTPNEKALDSVKKALDSNVPTIFTKGESTVTFDSKGDNTTVVQMTEEELKESDELLSKLEKGVGKRQFVLDKQKELAQKIRKRVREELSEGNYDSIDKNKHYQKEGNKQATPSVNNSMKQSIIDMGDGNATVESPSVIEQVQDSHDDNVVIENAEQLENSEDVNTSVGQLNDSQDNTLSANAMIPWADRVQTGTDKKGNPIYQTNEDGSLYRPLSQDGRIIHKQGKTPGDDMDRFYKWMEKTMKINLQNIIDQELARIIEANDKPLKVKFMCTKVRNIQQEQDVTDDNAMRNSLLLVLDYDNAINPSITDIHNDANGGVIEALGSDGKKHKYLIIGVAGYGNATRNPERQALYDILFSKIYTPNKEVEGHAIIKQERRKFFAEHPDERFYVTTNFETEIVPNSLIPGWIVKQREGEVEPSGRLSISELLETDRNPLNLRWEDLAWYIQELTKAVVINAQGKEIMSVGNPETNSGRVFVLIPAGNGKLLPSYIWPTMYTEIRSGSLKNRIDATLSKMCVMAGPNAYTLRYNALVELVRLFHFSKEGKNILLSKDGRRVTLKSSTVTIDEIDFTSENAGERFLDAFNKLNPHLNITASVLRDVDTLKEYDEAGALLTDIAYLHTTGSSYSVYAVDANGNMLKPEQQNNTTNWGHTDRNAGSIEVFFSGRPYRYNNTTGQFTTETGKAVTNTAALESLHYNRRILEGGLMPIKEDPRFKYYNLGADSNPEIVKVENNTYKVTRLSEEEASNIVQELKAKEEEQRRQQAIEEAMKNGLEDAEDIGVDVQPQEQATTPVVDISELPFGDTKTTEGNNREESSNPPEKVSSEEQKTETPTNNDEGSLEVGRTVVDTISFVELCDDLFTAVSLYTTIVNHWPEAPVEVDSSGQVLPFTSAKKVADFLRSKNIEVDAMDRSEKYMETWLQTLIECR